MEETENKNNAMDRRSFIRNTALATAGFMIMPSHVISGLGHTMPSDKLNIAGVGVGGRGGGVMRALSSQNIVALCDVDWRYSARIFNEFPDARKFYDWRVMFDQMKDSIDAVVVATPDHTHAIVSINAMKLGKHVYCDKPLTHSVWESREMTRVANQYKVATQMGNQGNSGEGIRQVCEWVWDGAIGEIKEAHAWTNRPIWPQGLERPQESPPVPDTLRWDLFLGPAADRPYNPIYTPWNWRGWWDFGTGALGDMACHIMDPIFMSLRLNYPTRVLASSSLFNTESPPLSEVVRYVFPEREKFRNLNMPEVTVTWWDGGLLPPRPEELPDGERMGRDPDGGCLLIGTKGKLMTGCYGRNPFLLPLDYDKNYQRPAPELRRVTTSHEMDWVRACKESPENRVETSSHFGYAGPMNEMVVMGVVAVRLQDLKRELQWDGKNMRFTNISDSDEIRVVQSDKFEIIDGHPHFETRHETMNAKQAAEEYIKHTYRDGWSI
jgi:hypothetical protein